MGRCGWRSRASSVPARSPKRTPDAREAHVGHYLIGFGRRQFEEGIGWVPGSMLRIRRLFFRWATPGYLGTIAIGTALLVAAAVAYAYMHGWRGPMLWSVVLLTVLPASELTIQILQRIISQLIPPRRLPRLEYVRVPESARTMVIIPTILDNVERVRDLVAHVEVQALGNLDPHIHFAILSDFSDAPTESLPQRRGNSRGGRRRHRRAQRQARQRAATIGSFCSTAPANGTNRKACGWGGSASGARSRNSTVCCAARPTRVSSVHVGDLAILPQVRYCITLDSDTRLPRDVARQLIGIITHPLNRPRFDPAVGRVTDGYGILQPRVSVTFTSAAGSLFARLYSGHTGVDPYTTAVSDTYQDLFGEGIFTGKGLYDVDAFIASLDELRARERPAVSRPVRGTACPRGAGLRRRVRRRISVERADACAAAAPVDSRRLADSVLVVPVRADPRRLQAQHAAAHRPLEDPRQSPPQPGDADAAGAAGRRLDDPPGRSPLLDRHRLRGDRLAAAAAGRARDCRTGKSAVAAGVLAQPARRHGHRARAGDPDRHLSGLSRLGYRARHRADAGPAGDHQAAAARMGDRGDRRRARGRHRRRQGAAAVCRRHDGQSDHRVGRRGAGAGRQRARVAGRVAVSDSLDRRAGDRLLAERPGRPPRTPAERSRTDAAAPHGANHLALLRDVRHRSRRLAAAGQLSGNRGRADARPAHLSDQHRDGAALDAGRARSRVL